MHGQFEANLAVLLVLVVSLGPLELGDPSHFRPPLWRVVHVVRPSGGEGRHLTAVLERKLELALDGVERYSIQRDDDFPRRNNVFNDRK